MLVLMVEWRCWLVVEKVVVVPLPPPHFGTAPGRCSELSTGTGVPATELNTIISIFLIGI
jgi:hypothetical protein